MAISHLNERLYARLKESIQSGAYAGGMRFPPEIKFAAELGVARNTLRTALAKLEAEGLVRRERSKGTFPVPRTDMNVPVRYLFCSGVHEDRYSGHIVPMIIQGVERSISGRGIEIDICTPESILSMSREESRQVFHARNIRGVILHDSNFLGNELLCVRLKELRVPVVLCYCRESDYEVTGWAAIPTCTPEAWRAALETLRRFGHRKIVTVTSDQEQIRGCFEPEEYAAMLDELGIDPAPQLVIRCAMSAESVAERLIPLFERENPPSAVLCFSDYWAPLIYRALKKSGRRVPEDVSVMGYCGSPGSEYANPPLSTLAVGYVEIGMLAVGILDDAPAWFGKTDGGGEAVPPPFEPAPYMLKMRGSVRKWTGRK